MNDKADGMSDALNQMADAPLQDGDEGADMDGTALGQELSQEIADEPDDAPAAGAAVAAARKEINNIARSTATQARQSATTRPKRRRRSSGLKMPAIILCVVLGFALLIPAIWAVVTLAGDQASQLEGERTMALIMLTAWPLALALLAAALVMWRQLRHDRPASGGPARAPQP